MLRRASSVRAMMGYRVVCVISMCGLDGMSLRISNEDILAERSGNPKLLCSATGFHVITVHISPVKLTYGPLSRSIIVGLKEPIEFGLDPTLSGHSGPLTLSAWEEIAMQAMLQQESTWGIANLSDTFRYLKICFSTKHVV
jgi:hypothetical protein